MSGDVVRVGMDGLPGPVREALAKEVDDGEVLRWVGQPSPGHIVMLAAIPAVLAGVFFGVVAFGALYLARTTWLEVQGLSVPSPGERPSMAGVYGSAVLGGLVALGALAVLLSPWFAARRARRTVYAVTNTRVMRVVVGRGGAVKSAAVEPGHPLSVSRNEWSPDLGDVHLYPVAIQGQARAMLSLVGVENPREVERMIRQTFDPPR